VRLEERERRGGGGALLHEGFVLWAFQTHLILQVLEMKIIYGEFFVSIYLLLLYWKLLYSIHYILYLFLCWRKKFFFFWVGCFLTA